MEELNGGGWVEVELFNTTWGKQYIEYSSGRSYVSSLALRE